MFEKHQLLIHYNDCGGLSYNVYYCQHDPVGKTDRTNLGRVAKNFAEYLANKLDIEIVNPPVRFEISSLEEAKRLFNEGKLPEK